MVIKPNPCVSHKRHQVQRERQLRFPEAPAENREQSSACCPNLSPAHTQQLLFKLEGTTQIRVSLHTSDKSRLREVK